MFHVIYRAFVTPELAIDQEIPLHLGTWWKIACSNGTSGEDKRVEKEECVGRGCFHVEQKLIKNTKLRRGVPIDHVETI